MPSSRREPFVAIDFETATRQRDSACAVALVRVEDGRIVRTVSQLLRPPRREFAFTYVHGLTWEDVADAPSFAEAWPGLSPLLDGASTLWAHNASFDESVLRACCAQAHLPMPVQPFRCTVELARERWRLYPTTLPDVCRHLKIELDHHNATSDATACARIVLAANARRATTRLK